MMRQIKCFACGAVVSEECKPGEVIVCPKCETEMLVPEIGGSCPEKPTRPETVQLEARPLVLTSIRLPFSQVLELTLKVSLSLLLIGMALYGIYTVIMFLIGMGTAPVR